MGDLEKRCIVDALILVTHWHSEESSFEEHMRQRQLELISPRYIPTPQLAIGHPRWQQNTNVHPLSPRGLSLLVSYLSFLEALGALAVTAITQIIGLRYLR